mgnify:CR=1 FL=1
MPTTPSRSHDAFKFAQLTLALMSPEILKFRELVRDHGRHVNLNTPDTPGLSGKTLLCMAAQLGNTEAVQILAEAGADVNIADEDGYTPVSVAVQGNFVEPASVQISIRLPCKERRRRFCLRKWAVPQR